MSNKLSSIIPKGNSPINQKAILKLSFWDFRGCYFLLRSRLGLVPLKHPRLKKYLCAFVVDWEISSAIGVPMGTGRRATNCRFGLSYSFHFQDIPLGNCLFILACLEALSKHSSFGYSQLLNCFWSPISLYCLSLTNHDVLPLPRIFFVRVTITA